MSAIHSEQEIHLSQPPQSASALFGAQPSPITQLQRSGKEIIVLLGVAMGLVAYGWLHKWWGDNAMGMWVAVATVLAIGSFVMLVLVNWRDTLLWKGVGVVAAVVLAMNISVWWISGAAHKPNKAWFYWQWDVVALLFIALAWLQALLQSRRWRAVRYSSLFAHAWHNSMVMVLVGQFVGLCWLVLALWGGLFALVKVHFFAMTFANQLFSCVATGAMAGVGVVLARGQPRALQLQLQLVLALFKVLLPLLALVVVLFVVALPATGIQPLWETRKAALLLAVLQLSMLLFVNAVYQDGLQEDAPYPRFIALLVHTALVVLPVLGALGVWAVWLRVQQYGWTYHRINAMVVTVLLLLYGLGYAWCAVKRQPWLWLQGVGRFNALMSWVVLGVVLALHTPLLDAYRFSAHSQLQRLLSRSEVPWDLAQLQSLRFDHGRHGAAALAQLAQDPRAQTPEVQAVLRQLGGMTEKARLPKAVAQPKVPLRDALQLAPGHTAPPQDWWQSLENGSLRSVALNCTAKPLAPQEACVVLQLPLAQGQTPHPLLCQVHQYSPTCQVFERDAQQQWLRAGQLSWGGVPEDQRPALKQAIREGRLQVQPARWGEVAVPGVGIEAGRVR